MLITSLSAIALLIYLLSRRKKKELLLILGVLISCSAFIFTVDYIFNDVLAPHQKKRISILLGKEFDPHGAGYNLIQSKIAIGSGGLFGKGWLNGSQGQLDFLPERTTDFIFSILAEEFGLIGIAIIICIYLFIVGRGILIAINSQDLFSRLIAASISLTFFIYVFVNISMTIGLLPVVGVPLPLISRGGTSMVTLMILLGMLMSVGTHKRLVSK